MCLALLESYQQLHLLIIVTLSLSTPSRECQPTSVSEPSSLASFSATSLTSINSCPIDACRKLQRMFCLQGVRTAIRSQPLVKSRPHGKHSHKLNTSNLEVRTRHCINVYCIYCIESPNVTLFFRQVNLPLSPPSISPIWFRTRITGNNTSP